MDSSTSRVGDEKRRKEKLGQQIAVLQARLAEIPDTAPSTSAIVPPVSPKRKQPEPTILAPATPSPRKKRKLNNDKCHVILGDASRSHRPTVVKEIVHNPILSHMPSKIAPSSLLNKLSAINRPMETAQAGIPQRTVGFTETPPILPDTNDERTYKRDENLALVEELEPGPYEHNPPTNDPNFEQLEPNSGIRLSSRIVPHDDLQDHLRGRYYLSPSRLYSCIRLLPDKQGYDVPVPGDWVTIAVVAERGPVRFTRAPVALGREDGDTKDSAKKGKQKQKDEEAKPTGKKFVNMKLIDFGARSGKSSATGGQAVIRGDAFLSLLLFESDGFDLTEEDGHKARKLYKGGSRGAFESMAKVKEGDVIALLNPKILKPFQRSTESPHPVNNVLAVTPESAASILVIGRSKDLGMCTVLKKDGKACGGWCDKRVSEVCEYHVQSAVQRQRAGRAEFSAGTSGMSETSTAKRKFAYDPTKQWGLKPEENMSSRDSTYVISGHVVSGTSADPRTIYVTENIGREGQAKAKRKIEGKAADEALKLLLERDKEGMRAVMKAREFKKLDEGHPGGRRREVRASANLAGKEDLRHIVPNKAKSAYTAEVIKSLGFDPTVKPGRSRSNECNIQDKLDVLECVRKSKQDIELGPRPGPKIRSGVVVPISATKARSVLSKTLEPDVSNDKRGLKSKDLKPEPEGHGSSMIDLDDF